MIKGAGHPGRHRITPDDACLEVTHKLSKLVQIEPAVGRVVVPAHHRLRIPDRRIAEPIVTQRVPKLTVAEKATLVRVKVIKGECHLGRDCAEFARGCS